MDYITRHTASPQNVPQSAPLDPTQVRNSAGGFTWAVDDFSRLRRFLVLGSEGGSYYASERNLTLENVKAVQACVAADGVRTVNEIVAVSQAGRAPKNDQALFALAYASAKGDDATRAAAYAALPDVARIGTHLFQFLEYRKHFGGKGRGLRRAVQNWYNGRKVEQVQYQAIKYRQRNNWTHADALRIAHPVPPNAAYAETYRYIVDRNTDDKYKLPNVLKGTLLEAFEMLQEAAEDPDKAAFIIAEHKLPREAVPTELLNERIVWEALLQDMPMTALVRNLATMQRHGLLNVGTEWERKVIAQLGDVEALQKSRIHPLQVLVAQRTYASGQGLRGQNTWTPNSRIVDALDAAFYKTFQNVEPTGKRYLLALDVSSSMGWGAINGIPGFTPREASVAMALVTMNVEKDVVLGAFTTGFRLVSRINAGMRLNDAVRVVSGMSFGGTDCAQPMLWAQRNKAEFDAFVVYTDSETWAGATHPAQALRSYRESSGIVDAREVVVGMLSNGFTIADPSDPGMLDVVGFDSAAPQIISEFCAGRV